MQTIDFIRGIGYKVISFPDGEKHLKIDELNRKDTVAVVCRICNSDDLFLLMQLSDILNRQCIVVDKIIITYLMTMRCDRLFSFEEAYSLRIVADIINSFDAKKVIIIEPHSKTSLDLIKNSTPIYITGSISSQYNFIPCFPDYGAYLRYGTLIDSKLKPIICSKVRDVSTGKLNGFEIECKGDYEEGMEIMVMDDLCDGGGTFIGVGELLRELKPNSLSLCVTHAVQKNGIERVASVYDKVAITNSYKDWNNEALPQNITIFTINDKLFLQ